MLLRLQARLLPSSNWQGEAQVPVQAHFKNKEALTEVHQADQLKATSQSQTKTEVNTSNIERELFHATNGKMLRDEAIFVKSKFNDKKIHIINFNLLLFYFYNIIFLSLFIQFISK